VAIVQTAALLFSMPRMTIKRLLSNRVSTSITAALLLASLAPCSADPAPVSHYAPVENLEHVDVALIDRAEDENRPGRLCPSF